MNRLQIEELWKLYEREVLPRDAPAIQRSECRLAFWAGAAGLFEGILKMLEPGEEATEADLSAMDDLQRQFVAFAQTLRHP